MLLAAIIPGLDPVRAGAAIALRPSTGFASPTAFWNLPPLAGLMPAGGAAAQLRPTTQWFGLTLTIEVAGAALESHTLIDARTRPALLVRRSYGEPS